MMYDHDGAPLRTGRAAVNGTSLHFRTAGSGPAVVLLHGVPKTGYHWRHLVPKLTPHHTVVVPDVRGLGDSARPADGYDSATMSDDIAELMAGLRTDPRVHLKTVSRERYDEVVLLRDIQFHSLCEHHLLPFAGRAHIAYLPGEQVVGLGTLVRVVETLAARPQVQERLGEQIADTIAENLDTRGVLVVLDASHGCVTMRGGRQPEASTLTIAARGEYTDAVARAELIALIGASTGSSHA